MSDLQGDWLWICTVIFMSLAVRSSALHNLVNHQGNQSMVHKKMWLLNQKYPPLNNNNNKKKAPQLKNKAWSKSDKAGLMQRMTGNCDWSVPSIRHEIWRLVDDESAKNCSTSKMEDKRDVISLSTKLHRDRKTKITDWYIKKRKKPRRSNICQKKKENCKLQLSQQEQIKSINGRDF